MKHVFENKLEFEIEDSGFSWVGDVVDKGDERPFGLFVRVQSYDESREHGDARELQDERVRVTVELVKQPIYEHKPGYELGMGDFLIQQAQLLEAFLEEETRLDLDTSSSVYEVLQALKKRIGTTPYTPDGCRIPYYPI